MIESLTPIFIPKEVEDQMFSEHVEELYQQAAEDNYEPIEDMS